MIIGITGTLGAGKGKLVEFLKEIDFKHYSARELISEEIISRNLNVDRDTLIMVSNDLRENFGPEYLIKELYRKALKDKNKNVVIESIRCIGEVEYLKKQKDFILFAVDADPKIRFDRIKKRNSETDNISFEKFLFQEKIEFHSDDDFKQNLKECIEMSDYRFNNNGTPEELKNKLIEVLNKIGTKN